MPQIHIIHIGHIIMIHHLLSQRSTTLDGFPGLSFTTFSTAQAR